MFEEERNTEIINGQQAVAETLALKAREEAAAREAEALRQAQAIEEARRIAQENRARMEAEEAARRQREAEFNRQKALAEKARRKMKRRSLVSILAACLAVAALAFGLANYQAVQKLSKQLSQLESRYAGQTISRSGATTIEGTNVAGVSLKEGSVNTSLTDVSDIMEEALRFVVSIEVKQTVKVGSGFYGSREYQTEGAGSGVIIGDGNEELWIATNYHVIEGAEEINIIFVDGSRANAYVKGSDQENDLAVLGIQMTNLSQETLGEIRRATMGSSDSLRLGEGVIAIGNALGFGQSVTTGVVSALERSVTFSDGTTMELLQISAAINPGNSGGALLNAKGELIGINNAKYSDEEVEGVGFAIPISGILEIMEELSQKAPRIPVSEDDYPYLGVVFKNLSQEYTRYYDIPYGAYVYEVAAGTPAEEAGLLAYDVITALDGVKISSYDELVQELQYHSGGSRVTLTLMRLDQGSYKALELEITLGYKKDYSN